MDEGDGLSSSVVLAVEVAELYCRVYLRKGEGGASRSQQQVRGVRGAVGPVYLHSSWSVPRTCLYTVLKECLHTVYVGGRPGRTAVHHGMGVRTDPYGRPAAAVRQRPRGGQLRQLLAGAAAQGDGQALRVRGLDAATGGTMPYTAPLHCRTCEAALAVFLFFRPAAAAVRRRATRRCVPAKAILRGSSARGSCSYAGLCKSLVPLPYTGMQMPSLPVVHTSMSTFSCPCGACPAPPHPRPGLPSTLASWTASSRAPCWRTSATTGGGSRARQWSCASGCSSSSCEDSSGSSRSHSRRSGLTSGSGSGRNEDGKGGGRCCGCCGHRAPPAGSWLAHALLPCRNVVRIVVSFAC